MTPTDAFASQVAAWLRSESPEVLRAEGVEVALTAARGVSQRRGLRAALTGPGTWPAHGPRRVIGRMPVSVRLVVIAAALLAVLAGAAFAGSALLRLVPAQVQYKGLFIPVGPAPGGIGSSEIGLQDGRVLFVGGFTPSGSAPAGAVIWDPADGSTVEVGSITSRREQPHLVVLADGKVLIIAGEMAPVPTTDDGQGVLWSSPSAEVFDPETSEVQPVGPPVVARWMDATVRLSDGRVLVTGGRPRAIGSAPQGADVPLADAEIFDPATGAFTRVGSMVHARAGHSTALLPDGSVLVGGGGVPELEIFDPARGTFSDVASAGRLEAGRLVRLAGGEVLLVDGYCSEIPRSPTADRGGRVPNAHDLNEDPVPVHRYDPATRSLVALADLPHCTDTSTPLPDGRLFVTGFWNEGQTWSGIYDPVAGTTQLTQAPAEGRYKDIVPLADGRVLKVSSTMELFQ